MTQTGAVYGGAEERRIQARARRMRMIRYNRMMLRITACLVVVCLFAYISRMAVIASSAKEISNLRKELTQLREEQQYLELYLAAQQDLNRVRDEAMVRLGMRYPEDGQVRLVSLSGYAMSANSQTALESTAP